MGIKRANNGVAGVNTERLKKGVMCPFLRTIAEDSNRIFFICR